MAVQRIWFTHIPDGTINAADRARIGLGYGGIALSAAAAGLNLKAPQVLATKQGYQVLPTKQGYQVLPTKRMGQIQWEN